MEVHHHTHTQRKKFRHYLFEFFMLFLAVFCGFLAEYFLEHTIEHQREEQFIRSMISDLKDDTAKISKTYEFNKIQLLRMDTLLGMLYGHPTDPDSIKRAYHLYTIAALNYEMVVFTDRTLTQMKNSGSLRLIRKQAVSDSIMNYDAGIKNCELQFEVVKESWKESSSFSYQLFNLGRIYRSRYSITDTSYSFISTDKALMTGYTNRLLMFAGVIRGYTHNIAEQKESAVRLIRYLEAEYD